MHFNGQQKCKKHLPKQLFQHDGDQEAGNRSFEHSEETLESTFKRKSFRRDISASITVNIIQWIHGVCYEKITLNYLFHL